MIDARRSFIDEKKVGRVPFLLNQFSFVFVLLCSLLTAIKCKTNKRVESPHRDGRIIMNRGWGFTCQLCMIWFLTQSCPDRPDRQKYQKDGLGFCYPLPESYKKHAKNKKAKGKTRTHALHRQTRTRRRPIGMRGTTQR